MNKTITGYKFIKQDMNSIKGGTKWRLKQWKKHKGEINLCQKGFHATRTALQSLDYPYGPRWFIVEAKGEFKEKKDDKFVASEMRLVKELPTKKIAVEFAIKCAKRCLKNFEKEYPEDKRPREAIEATKNWLKKPTKKNGSAARFAAESAWSAAWSARSAGSAARSARSAAESAAMSAWSAAMSAAESARSARSAGSAARSAGSAAWSARSARSAAESAAMFAEKNWQGRILNKIIKGHLK